MTRLELHKGAVVDLEDIKALQPMPRPVRRWLSQNVIAVGMLLLWGAGQLLSGDRWVQTRSVRETDLAEQVRELKEQLAKSENNYVRQDVFAAELRGISAHLASIDAKLDRR